MHLLAEISFNWQNMIDAEGPMQAVVGMSIVFLALAVISLFIAVLPYLLRAEKEAASTAAAPRSAAGDEAAIAAAIGFVLHTEKENK